MKLSIIGLLCLLIIGCAGKGVRPLYVKDGRQVFEAKCNGGGRTIGDCHQQAATACGGEFQALNEDSSSGIAPVGGRYVSVMNRSLMFVCSQ